jgi:hypothetical protein
MERFKNWLLASMGLVIFAFTLSLTDAGHAAASALFQVAFTNGAGVSVGNTVQLDQTTAGANGVRVAASSVTHVGQKPSDLVTLRGGGVGNANGSGTFFYRFNADGTADPPCASPPNIASESCYYTPPPGKVLVITDCSWMVLQGPPNEVENVLVFLFSPSGLSTVAFTTTAMTDSFGEAGTSVHLTSGFVVKSGGFVSATFGVANTTNLAITLFGYLIDDQ